MSRPEAAGLSGNNEHCNCLHFLQDNTITIIIIIIAKIIKNIVNVNLNNINVIQEMYIARISFI